MRKFIDPVVTAWMGIATHKLRSVLTILGIVIGVAAVITLMSIGRGAQAQIVSRIESLGSNLIVVRPGATVSFGGVRGGQGSAVTLTYEDAQAIASSVDYIATVAPSYSASQQLVAGRQNTNAQVIGVTLDYEKAYNLQTTGGTFISDYDYQSAAQVAVLGSNVASTLFAGTDPIGQQIRMGHSIVYVIGVLKSKGEGFGSTDSAILIPLTAMQTMIAQPHTSRGEQIVSSVAVTMTDKSQSSLIVSEITSLLRTRHQLSPTADNDFNISSMEELIATISSTLQSMTLLLGAIAAISLLVGGIGVMNIMLVSVLERTREIGIRMALGAQERDIWTQFLLESASLTLTGGIIGVGVGWIAATLVARSGSLPTVVSADIVTLAVSVSVGIGVFFGFYPAWNASRLNPIEALRAE